MRFLLKPTLKQPRSQEIVAFLLAEQRRGKELADFKGV
jgi:hypothetical protein